MEVSRPLRPDSIGPAAEAMAQRYKAFSVVPFAIATVFFLGFLSQLSRHGLVHGIAATIITVLLMVLAPAWGGIALVRRAQRYSRAGRMASDPTLTWHLSGTSVVASDARHAPRLDASFTVTAAIRDRVLAPLGAQRPTSDV